MTSEATIVGVYYSCYAAVPLRRRDAGRFGRPAATFGCDCVLSAAACPRPRLAVVLLLEYGQKSENKPGGLQFAD